MAILTKTRAGEAPAASTDKAVRMSVMDRTDSGVLEVWCEWNVQLPNGKYATRSARCDAETEAAIFALPNLMLAFQMAADSTHPQVTA